MTVNNRAHSGYAEVNGTRLYYEVAGEGHPLVLLHGGLVNLRSWDSQVVEFAQHYKVIRYDLRGMGASEVPTAPFSHEEDLRSLLQFLGINSAYLLGLSFGGRTALNFTLLHPEMVDALILCAPGLGGYDYTKMDQQLGMEIDEAYEQQNIEQAAELETRLWIAGPERTVEQVDPVVFRLVKEWNAHNIQLDLRRGEIDPLEIEPPAIGRLGEIQKPTLVLIGDKDVYDMLDIAQKLATEIPGARKVVIPDTAHALNMEKPAEFNQAVLDFLKSLA